MAKKSNTLLQVAGIVLIAIGLWGLSPWLGNIPMQAIVQVGSVTIKEIPPYDASRIGISVILIIAGLSCLMNKISFIKKK